MSGLLYEYLMNNPIDNEELMSELDRAEVIEISNVASYFYEIVEQDMWDITTDFPKLTPPFKKVFFEYRQPDLINIGGERMAVQFGKDVNLQKIGLFLSSDDADKNEEIRNDPGFQYMLEDNVRWIVALHPFFLTKNKQYQAIEAPMIYFYRVKRDGSAYMPRNNKPIGLMTPNADKSWQQEMIDGFTAICGPSLLAISLMHCKNVELIERGPGTKIDAKRRRDKPKYRYHVLEIEPMKKVLRTEGQSEKTGLKKALHICRGHFKDYRESGLFGRFHDIYWWDSHVRGSIEEGIVDKDYSVKAPKDD